MLPEKLHNKLEQRQQDNAFRQLGKPNQLIDFSSNDYLGFARSKEIFNSAFEILKSHKIYQNGATGSRLLSGNYLLYDDVEATLCEFHTSESALIFNSGYTANLGLFSCIPQRGDIILYDELIHASVRDGIAMSNAKSYKFKHNDLTDLEGHLERSQEVSDSHQYIYVVTESVFSMDGDSPDLRALAQLSKTYNTRLIIDEAHAIGICGEHGAGKIQELQLQNDVFARIITFGKALGSHGAAILCDQDLKTYLVNFSRPFIYTTALPPHSLATIKTAYEELVIQQKNTTSLIKSLHHNIRCFISELNRLNLQQIFIKSNSAIHCCVISGNEHAKHFAQELQNHGFDVKAILSPTVPKGKERLRFCLHSYNSSEEITKVLELLATFV